jgi:nitrite reductase/ring-hydroxylating ferredoxin subunit
MKPKFLKRNFFQRILGIPATPQPTSSDSWQYDGTNIALNLDKTPELEKPGSAIRLEGGELPIRVLVMRDEDGKIRAFENRCTHGGHRRLDPVPGTNTVQCCSVSKSTYDYSGNRIYGPAPGDIATLPTELHDKQLVIKMEKQ